MQTNTKNETKAKSGTKASHGTRASNGTRARPRRARQGELLFRSWGGARRGAGRKPKGARALVAHDTRPQHKARFPLLITSRLLPGLPSLRRASEAARVRSAIAAANLAARGLAESQEARHGDRASPTDPPFQVVHHSIQSNHLHLIVEAADRAALTSGLRGLLIRIAHGLNRLWEHRGAVFADRFHERELQNPRQVRNALVYVLQNLRKHGICVAGPDPLSSGPEFDGWLPASVRARESGVRSGPAEGGGAASRSPITLLRAARAETPTPRTWLLGAGWRRHGLIDPDERPRSA